MSSKQLSSLLRKAPPATAPRDEVDEPAAAVQAPAAPAVEEAGEPEVPLQVKIPASIRKKIDYLSVERGESLRTLVLRGFQSLGVEVPETELKSRRRRHY